MCYQDVIDVHRTSMRKFCRVYLKKYLNVKCVFLVLSFVGTVKIAIHILNFVLHAVYGSLKKVNILVGWWDAWIPVYKQYWGQHIHRKSGTAGSNVDPSKWKISLIVCLWGWYREDSGSKAGQHRELDMPLLVPSEDILIIDCCGICCCIAEHLELWFYPVSDNIYYINGRAPCWNKTLITKI